MQEASEEGEVRCQESQEEPAGSTEKEVAHILAFSYTTTWETNSTMYHASCSCEWKHSCSNAAELINRMEYHLRNPTA
jgi:hypothetical protein